MLFLTDLGLANEAKGPLHSVSPALALQAHTHMHGFLDMGSGIFDYTCKHISVCATLSPALEFTF